MKIDIKSIRELTKSIEKYGLEEITLESDGVKLTLKKETPKVAPVLASTPTQVVQPTLVVEEAVETQVEEVKVSGETVVSPMIGTYYGSPSPDADLFVSEGQVVEAGDILCIVEAMKLMNEVRAEKRCKIIKILMKDGNPVTKGTDLFVIEEA